jgi:Phosphotransferase enzyme family
VNTTGEPSIESHYETSLRLTVEHLLLGAKGCGVKISSMRREPTPFVTLFPAEVLSVSLENGDEMSFFVKHLGFEQSDHPDKQCRDREVLVYEALLRADHLPAVKYYGSQWNEISKRREVFLGHIDDWNLKYHDLEHWFTAARRLAHLHAYFATRAERLSTCDFLLRLDARYLCEWADRALSVVADQSPELAAELASVVDNYNRVAEVLARQPLTLVHNDLAPKNVIADRSSSPARICFIDWEMAGVGCGLMDLVHLKYGLDPVNDQKMCMAYCEELAGTDLLPPDPQDRNSLFAACEVHQTIYLLAHSKSWRLPTAKVAQWVMETEQFMARI